MMIIFQKSRIALHAGMSQYPITFFLKKNCQLPQDLRGQVSRLEEESLRHDEDWESALARAKEEVSAIRLRRNFAMEGNVCPKKEEPPS